MLMISLRIGVDEILGENLHVAREHDEIHAVPLEHR